MTAAVALVFAAVYLGMIAGALPFLQLDRTGITLLGAIAIVGLGALSPEQAAQAVHLPTILLLFAFMVISAQLRLGGFYTWVTRRVAQLPLSPPVLLGVLIAAMAALSAVFSNDIVCLAAAPVLARICIARRLDPLPFLLALACAANVGSAATLIGNPQNMLIGATLGLDFAAYTATAVPIIVPGLVATWIICMAFSWNEFLFGLSLTTKNAIPMPVIIAGAEHTRGVQFWFVGVRVMLTMLPPTVLALLAQRYIIRGLTLGAVKG